MHVNPVWPVYIQTRLLRFVFSLISHVANCVCVCVCVCSVSNTHTRRRWPERIGEGTSSCAGHVRIITSGCSRRSITTHGARRDADKGAETRSAPETADQTKRVAHGVDGYRKLRFTEPFFELFLCTVATPRPRLASKKPFFPDECRRTKIAIVYLTVCLM